MTMRRFRGLVAAAFSPMNVDGTLALDRVPELVEHLIAQRVSALFVGGTTGEGPSLTIEERAELTEAYLTALDGRLPIIAHVGHNCLRDAARLAEHAQQCGAAAIGAAPPSYFPIPSVEVLADCLGTIAAGAPQLPLYYYHIPPLTEVELPMHDLLTIAPARLPSLAGIKFSDLRFDILQRCVDDHGSRYNLLFGSDEMLLHGLVAGADGAVGSTYNFMGRLFGEVIGAFAKGDLVTARDRQGQAGAIVHAILRHPTHPALKATMKLAGVDVGPPRLPLPPLTKVQTETLAQDLREAGFFEWV